MPTLANSGYTVNAGHSDYQFEPTRDELQQSKSTFDPLGPWDWQNKDMMGPQGQALPDLAVGWQPNGEADFGGGLTGWWKKVKSNIKSAFDMGYEEGIKLSGLEADFYEAKETGQALTQEEILQGEARAELTVEEKNLERKKETSGLVGGLFEAGKEVLNQTLWSVLDGLGAVSIAAEQTLGSTAYAIADTIEGKDINWKRNWEASRLLYSGLFDATVFTEMERRIDSGMDGRLAAQELMANGTGKLWPELIGQIIFDPLNFIAIPLKAAKTAKMIKKVNTTFHTIDNPVIREFVEGAVDLKNLDDARSAAKLNQVVSAQQNLSAAMAHGDELVNAEKKLDVLSKTYLMSSSTSTGKAAHLGNESTEILMHIVNNTDPDEALDILKGMINSASSNPNVAAEGISAMMHFPDATSLFSRAGNDTTVMLAKMFDKYGATWLNDLDSLKGDPSELIKNLMGKVDDIAADMFPSVNKMMEAEATVKAAKTQEQIDALSDATKALAEKSKVIPRHVKLATQMHEKAQKVVGPLNRYFAGVYMGWSPGYAFRNWSNNTMQILVDQGPAAIFTRSSADELFEGTRALAGGSLQDVGGFSPVTGLFDDATTVGKSDIKSTLKNIKEQTGLKKGPSQILGEAFELNGAKRIVAREYTKTFKKGMEAAVKTLAPDLRAAGWSEDVIARMPQYIMQYKGDTAAIIDAIRADVSSGVVDLFNDISRIDPKHADTLEKLGKWEDYQDVLRAGTKEEAVAAANKIFDDFAKMSEDVYSESRGAMTINDQVIGMQMENGLPNTRGMAISYRQSMNDDVIKFADELGGGLDNLVSQYSAQSGKAVDIASLKKANGVEGIWGKTAHEAASNMQEIAVKIARKEMGKGNFAELWQKYPEIFHGPPPPGLDKAMFQDALWTGYDDVVSKVWKNGRIAASDGMVGYMDDLKAAGVPIPAEKYRAMKEAAETAAEWDDAMVGWNPLTSKPEYIKETRMPFGTRPTKIADLANQYGIASATPAGVSNDGLLLNTIKKYAKVDYKSLEEVPLTVAEEAFKIKRGLLNPIEIIEESVKITDEVGSALAYLNKNDTRLAADEFEEVFGGALGKDKQGVYPGLFVKSGGLGIDEIGVRLVEGGFMTADDAQDLNKVRDFLRGAKNRTATFTQEIRTGGQAGADITKAAADAAAIAKDAELGKIGYYDDAGKYVPASRPERLLPPAQDGAAPGLGRVVYEQLDELGNMKKWILDDIEKNFGKRKLVDPIAEKSLRGVEKELTQKIAETRLISSRVAKEARDFTLLNYGDKSYADMAIAYLYPYHYWYKGTYKNWMKRLVTHPEVLAGYQKYKNNLGQVHADMPEWWKYQLNSNDLPGVDTDNPLYFNLEATLWPLNGITGLDFNDASKRTGWWTKALDFAGKFGPSTWAPINIMTGIALHAKGEEEAGEKWMGRLFPQSATIKAIASKFGVDNLEVDPLVKMFSGNLDPYERRRVERAVATMAQEAEDGNSKWTIEQIQDAAYSQEGEIWDEAIRRAVHGRSNSQIASYMFGVGFKGRTNEDMEIDKFYGDYNRIWTMKAAMTPEEFKEGMSALQTKYPFMGTMLLSRRDDIERDAGLAYLVMQRIPPGSISEVARAVNIDPALLDKFFQDKGQLDKWSVSDRTAFMGGILTMSAVLEIPTDMTRGEWEDAKASYAVLTKDAKAKFGDGILDAVDAYYQAKTESYDLANTFLDAHPEVSQYMNWKAERIMGSPQLSAYYSGASMIEGYYRSNMYLDMEKQLGKDVFGIIDEYNEIKTYGTAAEKKSYYNQNKQAITAYYDLKDAWGQVIDQKTAELSASIPQGENAGIRQDIDVTSPTQTALTGALQPQQQMTYQQFQQAIPPNTLSLVQDYLFQGQQLPSFTRTQLGRLANDLGFADASQLIQSIGTSIYQSGPTQ